MDQRTRRKHIRRIALVILLAIFLHAWAVSLLPQDFDEPVYLQNAFDYANALRSGGLNAVVNYAGTSEHPAFVKLLYAVAVLVLGNSATWTNAFYASRIISAIFGTLAVVFVTLAVDPLSGAFLALNTLNLKYTSQVYLEAVPHAMTIAAVLAFLRVKIGKPGRWLWASAVALGVAAASKYSYLPVILIVLAYLALFEKKLRFHYLVAYALIAMAIFFFLDVHLWREPLQRLVESFSFHLQYSQGAHVEDVGYPWYQPFVWIFTSSPAQWHPQVFFYFGFDTFFAILAFAGLPREWRERRWLVIWLLAGIAFLLLWPTKWPQYALTVTPAICIIAAGTARGLYRWLNEKNTYWDYLRNLLPAPGKGLWILLSAFIGFLLVIYISAAGKQAIGRIGWSSINSYTSPLPGNGVNAILPLDDGGMLIGTSAGAALWVPPQDPDTDASWEIFNMQNSGILSNDVLSLAVDPKNNWWLGTRSGLNRFDGRSWSAYHATDMGLSDETILTLAAAPDGSIFVGTLNGAAWLRGTDWSVINQAKGQAVFSFIGNTDDLWMAVADGIWHLDLSHRDASFTPTRATFHHLMIDSAGTLWAATSGAGLAHWDESEWQYLTVANSGMPCNNVNWVAEIRPGVLWVATSYANKPGGVIASYEDGEWHSFQLNNSGVSGSEPLVITFSAGQIWTGTRSKGIDLYLLGR